MDVNQLDKIYEHYGYEIKKSHKNMRVYLFTKSIYSGAEIYLLDNIDNDYDRIRKEYTDSGYAVKKREYRTVEEAENVLFKEFFQIQAVVDNLQSRYYDFICRVMDKLSDESKYEYIKCPYEVSLFHSSLDNGFHESVSEYYQEGLVDKLSNMLDTHKGPLFVVLEAAAGYGKTCTAYEILHNFLKISNSKIPFFTELSRDRKATVFSHILRKEIEEQFANRVDSNVVIGEIKKGRIPLIIDGFDELISKDFSFSTSEFRQVESMLSTIVDLLSDNAKIVITSRKTAIFNSEDFFNWMSSRSIDYTMAKITISEPLIDNWLSKEQLDIIDAAQLPIDKFANPVLLAFMKYSSISRLEEMVIRKNSIVNEYLTFLMEREQTRQNLLIEPNTQLRIFRKLVRLFAEFDIKTASKEDIKDFILEFNRRILHETLEKYLPTNRPHIEQLADTLSNHAFLDKKDSRNIGFVNEFILGTLVAQNLVLGKFFEHNKTFYVGLNILFANLALQSYKVQSQEERHKLWEVFNSFPFDYDAIFYLQIDVHLKNKLSRKYSHLVIDSFSFDCIKLTNSCLFEKSTFTNCSFSNCIFALNAFINCSFVKCKFYDCSIDVSDATNNYIGFFTCEDNNDFLDKIESFLSQSNGVQENYINLEQIVLEKFFNQGSLRPRYRQVSQLNYDLENINARELTKQLHTLSVNGYLAIDGNLCHLTKEGITYYNDTYRK
ncbi:hypothetical protein G7050_08230 [Dysgonomonas sp. HDW5A]|uniref:hypothetical protein n=1 Tax=Dysgonomonas sp. HDW5A TaxID=2714926 RepID=UPI00140838FE|nr:hypothetical protein [Dysgonomonas sp. HDW5A]QIK59819.1 hypothetical protein G7050_08230 [Dysgonomonas sp. HDW5A]